MLEWPLGKKLKGGMTAKNVPGVVADGFDGVLEVELRVEIFLSLRRVDEGRDGGDGVGECGGHCRGWERIDVLSFPELRCLKLEMV